MEGPVRLYAVVEWDGGWSIVELAMGDASDVIVGTPVAECPDRDVAYRLARMLVEEARDATDLSVEP